MKKMLITGGTEFVSRSAARYFSETYEVYVLNRGNKPQCPGVIPILADRHHLGNVLKNKHFHAVLDITAYNREDVEDLLDGLDTFDDYILISSSAVYPETGIQPFVEDSPIGPNAIWGSYGIGKIEAEQILRQRFPHAYILRPPYLYGPGNNVYREAFAFDCALAERPFYIPGDGSMTMQFFHVDDLCRFMELLLEQHPSETIYNVGNPEPVSIREWAAICYQAAGKVPQFVSVSPTVPQRGYFPFHNYAYQLSVDHQKAMMPSVKDFSLGLMEAFQWYQNHESLVLKRPYWEFIDTQLR